ncbi:hypothetical protein AKJ45_02855 [candidate division MSBL1 archaeon SCGC-AAA261F19]|uniref:type I site-specific deoxyribonuclease n=2 Tax=candidate division MSBL1 TaxID=215777 RepID=A0A133V961_9EURY|nr:hypothetical protein AKJ43_03125 [candidate division MSBL1 archaeon SCGC-AAA261D19]KXB02998.1 hypothetical protein AKJ45_02855 [candidate division MSBL1 archaeon SCGC-AAA261F19]
MEKPIVEWLEKDLGWEYKFPREMRELRPEVSEPIVWKIAREKLIELNGEINENNVEKIVGKLRVVLNSDLLLEGNEEFLEWLRGRKSVKLEPGEEKKTIRLIDFEDLERNSFIVTRQFTVRREHEIRCDIVLFVNGFPLVDIEAKSPALQEGDYRDAINQIGRYQREAPRLYIPNLLNVATDGIVFKYGPTGASAEDDFSPWKRSSDYDVEGVLKKGVYGLLDSEVLLDIVKNFVFFEKKKGATKKIVCRYFQYYAANKIVERVRKGERKRGLIWHFQRSGKSYTMMFAAWKLRFHPDIKNPQIFIVVDRKKLERQMLDKLNNVGFPNMENAVSIENLENLIKTGQRKVIVTTIHKFRDTGDRLNEYENIIVLADEAHRSEEKTLGMEMRSALPNAFFFGFTGTPVKKDYRNTYRSFGPVGSDEPYLDKYSFEQGVKDGLILRLFFERRMPEWSIEGDKLDEEFKRKFKKLSKEERSEILREEIDTKSVIKIRKRIKRIAKDIADHYKEKIEPNGFKAQVVTIDKEAAALYKEELDKHMDPEESAVIISSAEGDKKLVKKYHLSSEEQERLIERFKDKNDPLKVLIVCDMLLTGFDAPIEKVMYLDKPRSGHNLLQTTARTINPYPGKNNGLVVDYFGVFSDWDAALGEFKKSEIKGVALGVDKLKEEFEETIRSLMTIFEDVEKEEGYEAWRKAVNIIESNEKGRMEFEEKIRKLKNLYESIAPDPFLKNFQEEYKWLCEIDISYRKKVKREEKAEREEFGEKTKEMIEENVDVKGINDNFPLYEVDQDYLSKVKEKYASPKERASEIEHAVRSKLHIEMPKNSRYESLAKRLEKIISRRRKGDLDDIEALKKLEDLTEETVKISASAKAGDMGLTSGEYAIYELLKQYTEGAKEEKLRVFAKEIGSMVEKETSNFPYWNEKIEIRKEIKKQIKLLCLKKYSKFDLYGSGFADEALGYIIEHYGEG